MSVCSERSNGGLHRIKVFTDTSGSSALTDCRPSRPFVDTAQRTQAPKAVSQEREDANKAETTGAPSDKTILTFHLLLFLLSLI